MHRPTIPEARHALLLALLSLVLAACGGTARAPAFDPSLLAGRLAAWNGGATTVQAVVLSDARLVVVGGGTIEAGGAVRIELREDVPGGAFGPLADDGLTLSDPAARVLSVDALLVGGTDAPRGFLAFASDPRLVRDERALPGDRLAFHWYADRDVTARGRLEEGSSYLDVDLTLLRGWNALVATVEGDDETFGITLRTARTLAGLELQFVPFDD